MKRLCQGVEVGRPSFYAWIAGADARAQRQADDDALAERIKRVHHADRATAPHGSPLSSTTLPHRTTPQPSAMHRPRTCPRATGTAALGRDGSWSR